MAGDVVCRPAEGILTVDGRGFGHGRGLSQYGAYGAALRGLGYAQILADYYDGAILGSTAGAVRRVLITGEDTDVVVSIAPGLMVRNEASGAVLDAGGQGESWGVGRAGAARPTRQAPVVGRDEQASRRSYVLWGRSHAVEDGAVTAADAPACLA